MVCLEEKQDIDNSKVQVKYDRWHGEPSGLPTVTFASMSQYLLSHNCDEKSSLGVVKFALLRCTAVQLHMV